jgi:ketosteroid isomerase-like protein
MSREAEALREANALFYAALERLDMGDMDALWLQSEDSFCVHPGWDALFGWDAVRGSWERIFASTSWLRVTPTEVRARVVGEVGVVTCSESISTREGDQVGIAAARSTNLFRRTPHGWRLFHHHASPAPVEVPPLGGTPQ